MTVQKAMDILGFGYGSALLTRQALELRAMEQKKDEGTLDKNLYEAYLVLDTFLWNKHKPLPGMLGASVNMLEFWGGLIKQYNDFLAKAWGLR